MRCALPSGSPPRRSTILDEETRIAVFQLDGAALLLGCFHFSRSANCGKSSGDTIKLRNCTACRLVKYCGADCQKAHRKQHKKACKQRVAELKEEQLYSQGHERLEGEFCPICTLPIALPMGKHAIFAACCMKMICKGCNFAANKRGTRDCPFCRTPYPDNDAETLIDLKLLSIPWLRRLTMIAFLSLHLSILASTSLHCDLSTARTSLGEYYYCFIDLSISRASSRPDHNFITGGERRVGYEWTETQDAALQDVLRKYLLGIREAVYIKGDRSGKSRKRWGEHGDPRLIQKQRSPLSYSIYSSSFYLSSAERKAEPELD